ncbi:MAG TPA: VTT domain-containing protein [Candidatus Saccharimonadales bacterium]|nr:VTT domain-containing protein [Candidatus Saccharimonadales bacterium]
MNDIAHFLEQLMKTVPLELFVFIGTCIDEIISPIPALLVLLPAGIAAHVQSLPWWYLGVLALISGVARALSGYILYLLADKLENVLFANGRKFFGYTHRQIESYGIKLGKEKPAKSWWILFTMHALPVFPGTLLSLGSGFIRLPLSIFFTSSALGSAVAAIFFLGLGYSGVQTAELLGHLDTTTQITTVILVLLIAMWLIWRYKKIKAHSTKS